MALGRTGAIPIPKSTPPTAPHPQIPLTHSLPPSLALPKQRQPPHGAHRTRTDRTPRHQPSPCGAGGRSHGAPSLEDGKQDPLPQQPVGQPGSAPAQHPGPEGAPTLETVMGFPKSLPPVMRKPHGAGPAKVTVTGMAAGGSAWTGGCGVGKSGTLRGWGRGEPPAPHRRGPGSGVLGPGSAFLPGRGPAPSRRRRVPAAAASSRRPPWPRMKPVASSPPRHRGDEGVPGLCAHGTAGYGGRGISSGVNQGILESGNHGTTEPRDGFGLEGTHSQPPTPISPLSVQSLYPASYHCNPR